MSFDTTLVNGYAFAAQNVVGVTAVNSLGGGQYSIDATEYGGALSDYYGPSPAANIATATTTAYNATLAPGVIEFQYTYQDGHTAPELGGQVIAWNANDILVQILDGFTPISQGAGTYVGTLDPSLFLVLGASVQNLSFSANGGAGPNLPITFGDTANFAVPEPSTYAILMIALAATTVVRHPAARRFLRWFGV